MFEEFRWTSPASYRDHIQDRNFRELQRTPRGVLCHEDSQPAEASQGLYTDVIDTTRGFPKIRHTNFRAPIF